MKIFFLVKGFGEYAQAHAVAKKLKEEKCEILFFCENPFIQQIILSDGFDLSPFSNADKIKDIISDISGEALFLCNSHTTFRYGLFRPERVKKIFTLDSNWYFNDTIYPYKNYPWVDTHYVVFPEKYFLSNLKENGGNFEIDPFYRKKIYTPGFVPTHRKLTLEEKSLIRKAYNLSDEKIFVAVYQSSPKVMKDHPYFLSREAVVADVEAILSSLEEIYKKQIIMINLSDQAESMKLHETEQFDDLIVSSDLVVLHHGYGTFPKLFRNLVPVISFTEVPQSKLYASYYEIQPAIKAGAIRHLFYENYKKEQLNAAISALLFDKEQIQTMKKNQESIFEDGIDDLIRHFHLHV